MCFCLSGCMINWWTHRSSLAFSFTALNPIFSGCFGVSLVFSCLTSFSRWSKSLKRGLFSTSLTFLEFLFPSFGIFSPFFFFFKFPAWSPALLCVDQPFLSPCSPFPFPPIFLRSSSPRVWFLGYALLTHCDPPALWTPRLPTGNHMLPQHSSGKPLDLLCGQTLSHKYWKFSPQGNITESIYWGTITMQQNNIYYYNS